MITLCFVCKDLITPYHWNTADMDQYMQLMSTIYYIKDCISINSQEDFDVILNPGLPKTKRQRRLFQSRDDRSTVKLRLLLLCVNYISIIVYKPQIKYSDVSILISHQAIKIKGFQKKNLRSALVRRHLSTTFFSLY